MTNLSSTLIFRGICEFCHSPPKNIKKIGKLYVDDDDLVELIKSFSKDHFYYVMSPSILGEVKDRVRHSYINFPIRDWKSSINILKRSKIEKNKIKNKKVSTVVYCQCKKSYWIIPSLDRDVYPELNRKSLLRK